MNKFLSIVVLESVFVALFNILLVIGYFFAVTWIFSKLALFIDKKNIKNLILKKFTKIFIGILVYTIGLFIFGKILSEVGNWLVAHNYMEG
ncbi:MAG: hypothetical protein WCK11_00215 [Candidatus Falkowbacteria bacterium]